MNESQAMLERSMRSVFVGNIPFDLTEDRLKDIFREAGPVLSFKLVYDRENGKPKGYGFCEYKDVETANSAMRNLNGFEIGGRILKVDNAANEKTRMELQNSISDPLPDTSFDNIEPTQVPESISKAVASLPPEQMFELMKQTQQCIKNNPTEARVMLLQNPQLCYGLLQSMVVMKIVDPEIALTILTKPNFVPDLNRPDVRTAPPPPPIIPQPTVKKELERPLDPRPRGNVTNMQQMNMASSDVDLRMPMSVPAPVMPLISHNTTMPEHGLRDPRQQPMPVQPSRDPRNMDPRQNVSAMPSRPPPPQKPPMAPTPQNLAGMNVPGMGSEGVSDQEKAALIMQVLQLTNEQIAMLPAEQRQSILLLKEQIAKTSQR